MTKKEMITKGLTLQHTGKMESIISLSTSTNTNPFCEKMRSIEGCICQKCYAYRMSRAYHKGWKENIYIMIGSKQLVFLKKMFRLSMRRTSGLKPLENLKHSISY